MAKERILLADDHPLVRAALLEAVRRLESDIEPVEVDSLGAAKDVMAKGPVDLVCLDLHMGDSPGFIGLTELRRDYPAIPVVIVSASDAPGRAYRAVEFGGLGLHPQDRGSRYDLCGAAGCARG